MPCLQQANHSQDGLRRVLYRNVERLAVAMVTLQVMFSTITPSVSENFLLTF